MFQTLSTVLPPTVEPISLDLARKHCRIDNNDDDDLLGFYVAAARAKVEEYLARALMTQTLRYTISQTPYTGGWPLTLSAPLILPMWMPGQALYQRPIELPRAPAQSVVAVSVSKADGVFVPLVAGIGYSFDAASTPGRVQLGSGYAPAANQDVTIDYVAGYGNDPALVPNSIRMGVLFATAWLYEHRGDDPAEMPAAAEQLLTPHRLYGWGG